MTFDRGELLRDAGYEEGDFIPQFVVQGDPEDSAATASSSFVTAPAEGRYRLPFGSLFGGANQVQAFLTAAVDPNGDTINIRLNNDTDSEIIISGSASGSGFQTVQLGPTDYTPSTTGSPVLVRVNIANNDGATTVTINETLTGYGVQL